MSGIKLPPLPELKFIKKKGEHMNTEQEREFEAWLPKAYRQPQESYSVHNMEVAFAAGYKAGRAAMQSQDVLQQQKDREDAERLRLRIETIRVLMPSTPSDEELDIAIDYARRVEGDNDVDI